ncbi:uncharacterized protein LOC122505226 [Leptopilina heterotoma]|uniref:uncharacterized protein LOC122505226 n=1 Tax=Leptopilina heterotoma TaxID=63436 RepID=UPI001CA81521|nr:uncharacterized protein LOC122505226 [Leptopilina heterotoma]
MTKMLKQSSIIIVFIFLYTFLVNGVISLPVVEKSINTNDETTFKQNEISQTNNQVRNNSFVEEIREAVYFPPSNGTLMHRISMRVKNDENNSKNCVFRVFRDNCTETSDKPIITFDCDELKRKKRDTSEPKKLNPNDANAQKYATIGVEKYAHTMSHSSGSTLDKVLDGYTYQPGQSLLYKIRILMNNCDGKKMDDCKKAECIVYVWQERIVDEPVSIECYSIRTKRSEDLVSLGLDNPEIRKYVDLAVERHVSPLSAAKDKNSVLLEFDEAIAYPPSGSLRYKIKLRIGNDNCTKGQKHQDCRYDSTFGSDDCVINVYREGNKEWVRTRCSRIGRRKREALTMEDGDIKKYVDNFMKTHDSRGGKHRKLILQEFKEASSYPPPSEVQYKIKLRIGTSNCSKEEEENCVIDYDVGHEDCELNVYRGSTEEPAVQTMCSSVLRRKREVEDAPKKLELEDPEIKQYVENLLKSHVSPVESAKDRKIILMKFKEASSYPPLSEVQYNIKLRIGASNCTKGSEEVNCVIDHDVGHEDCELNIYRGSDKEPAIQTVCSSILRRKREVEHVSRKLGYPSVTYGIF